MKGFYDHLYSFSNRVIIHFKRVKILALCLSLHTLFFLFILSSTAEGSLKLPVTKHVLANGMKFLIVERPEAPVFSAHLRKEDVMGFFKRYYAPNNAVVVIVGDVKTDLDKIQALTREYILNAAQKYLKPDKMLLVIGGNKKDLAGQLEKEGPVAVKELSDIMVN